MKNYLKNLQQRWGIISIRQFWLILIIFALSGTSTLFIKEPIFFLFDIGKETPLWIRIAVYIAAVIPGYFLILLFYATLFGQQEFFLEFIKKLLLKPNVLRLIKKFSFCK